MKQKEKIKTIVVNYNYWLMLGWLTLTAFIVGCSINPANIQDQDGEQVTENTSLVATTTATAIPPSATPQPSVMATRAVLSTSTLPPSPSATITSMPTETSTSSPTLTPLPTIDPSQRGQLYSELVSSNGGCILPCWWGFELGVTSLDEVRQFYTTFNTYITEQSGDDGISILEVKFIDPQIENGEQTRHSFVAQDGIMFEAEIQLKKHTNYQIGSVLQQLGQPAEVWMWTISEPYEGILPTRFQLYFPDKGILTGYATGGIKADSVVKVCFDKNGGTTLHLWDPSIWDPNSEKSIMERVNQSGSAFNLEGYHPLEEVSNWNVERFYTVLTDPILSECLETPSNLWLPP